MRGLITANLKVLGTYPSDNDKLIIVRGSKTSGSTSFSSLDGIGSNIHVVGLTQGCQTQGLWAYSGPPHHFMWPPRALDCL